MAGLDQLDLLLSLTVLQKLILIACDGLNINLFDLLLCRTDDACLLKKPLAVDLQLVLLLCGEADEGAVGAACALADIGRPCHAANVGPRAGLGATFLGGVHFAHKSYALIVQLNVLRDEPIQLPLPLSGLAASWLVTIEL